MRWKDSSERTAKEEDAPEAYFDEEQYSPWADRKDNQKTTKLNKVPVLFLLLAVAIVALVAALLMLIFGGGREAASGPQMAALEARLTQLEEKLNNYEAIDEKVTQIWQQAKSFEKFKDRFDRSEASTSLRMDHLTMSLEALQKQLSAKQTPAVPPPAAAQPVENKTAAAAVENQYHQVQAGDTLYSISKKYDLTVEELLKMNQMTPGSVIVPGQKLMVRSSKVQ